MPHLHRGPNNRSVTHHSVVTIGDDVTLIAKKTMVEIVIGLQKGHVICPKTMVESLIGSQNNHVTLSSIVAQMF